MMRRSGGPMTIPQLKRSMDRRFRSIKADVGQLRLEVQQLRQEMATKSDLQRSAEETRRHFDIVAESLRDDLRIFADAIAGHTGRLDQHETRITRLERRPV